MTNTELVSLLLSLVDVLIFIYMIAGCCYYQLQRLYRREDAADDRRQEAAAPPAPAATVQMTAIAVVALLDHATYPRQNSDDVGGEGGDDRRSSAVVVAEECAICLGKFEDGDWCSVMPVCRHEFHRSCIVKWLTVCNNTCPLCRAQLQWDVVAHDMV